jgi:C_GCAxxG_C_C family probable redox protein
MVEYEKYIEDQVHYFYHEAGVPCGVATIRLLSEIFEYEINNQVLDSAVGMVGAGKYGAQCGIVEGGLMFISIYCRENNIEKKELFKLCYDWTQTFEEEMGSIVCKGLRPFPFTPEDAPKHLCVPITVKGVNLAVDFIKNRMINK